MAVPAKSFGSELIGAVTLAVSPTGSDTDATRPKRIVRGDWSAKPFATIQAALDAVPKSARYAVTVNVGEGNFPGFYVEGFHAGYNGNVRVTGTRGLATLASGLNTGIVPTLVTGGRIIQRTGAGWTVDDLVGRYVSVTAGPGAGQILIIAANTVDTLTLAAVSSPAITTGSTLDIVEQKSIIDVPSGNYGIGVFNNAGYVYVDDFKVTAGTFRFVGTYNQNVTATRILTDGGSYGILMQDGNRCSLNQVGALNASAIGIACVSVGTSANAERGLLAKSCALGLYVESGFSYALSGGAYIRQSTGQAILARCMSRFQIDNLIVDGCTTGMVLEAIDFGVLQAAQINNCSIGPFSLMNTQMQVNTSLTGTGNSGWGMYAAGQNNQIRLSVTPTITGASGNATVDGTTALVWATDLAASGDYAYDIASGARIYRS